MLDEFNAFLVRGAGAGNGLDYAAKDNINTTAFPTTGATNGLRGSTPSANASIIDRLDAAGATLTGKLNMHELALGTTSDNGSFGAVLNPADPTRSPGGSSGGTAAAVAAGLVDFALGSDTGGSMRIPAAFCGVVGMRPTTGRFPSDGMLGISNTRDTPGVMARTVEKVAQIDALITGETDTPKLALDTLRLGLPRNGFFDDLSPEVATVVEFALIKIEEAGATLVETDVVDAVALAPEAGLNVVGYEAVRLLPAYLSSLAEPYRSMSLNDLTAAVASPDVRGALEHFTREPITDEQYAAGLRIRTEIQQAYTDAFKRDRLDALLYPTVPIVAPELHATTVTYSGIERAIFPTTIRNTDPGSLAGQPSVSIPILRAPGALPVGLGIEGEVNSDRRLLSISALLEKALA
ncbi:MAG: Indoleacetamide hydrolase [Actinomycetota bacterium]